MALWACLTCGCRYAVGLEACPQCRGTDHEEDGVAKITTGGGPSLHTDGGGDIEPQDVTEPEEAPVAPVPVADQLAAGVPKEETVTVAAQKAGAEPPVIPDASGEGSRARAAEG